MNLVTGEQNDKEFEKFNKLMMDKETKIERGMQVSHS